MDWGNFGPSVQKRDTYFSSTVDLSQVNSGSDSFLACIGKCMDLSSLDGAKSSAVIASRNGHFFQVRKNISPMTPALVHNLRERVVPANRVVVVCLLSHKDKLL